MSTRSEGLGVHDSVDAAFVAGGDVPAPIYQYGSPVVDLWGGGAVEGHLWGEPAKAQVFIGINRLPSGEMTEVHLSSGVNNAIEKALRGRGESRTGRRRRVLEHGDVMETTEAGTQPSALVCAEVAGMIAPFESRFRQAGWQTASVVLCAESSPQDLEQAVHAAMDDLGPLGAAVLVASRAPEGGLLEAGAARLDETLAANVGMLARAALMAAQRMLDRRSVGSIVFVEMSLSDGTLDEGRLSAEGAASGAALESLSRSMCSELGPHGIRVNAVRAQTRRPHEPLPPIPMGGPVLMECVAEVTVFLASDDASYISGAAVPVDGGLGVAR